MENITLLRVLNFDGKGVTSKYMKDYPRIPLTSEIERFINFEHFLQLHLGA